MANKILIQPHVVATALWLGRDELLPFVMSMKEGKLIHLVYHPCCETFVQSIAYGESLPDDWECPECEGEYGGEESATLSIARIVESEAEEDPYRWLRANYGRKQEPDRHAP